MARRDGRKRTKGATGLEMGVLLGVVAVIAVAATASLGGKVREIFGGTTNAVQLGMNGQLAPGANLSLSGGIVAPVPPVILTSSLPAGGINALFARGVVIWRLPAREVVGARALRIHP